MKVNLFVWTVFESMLYLMPINLHVLTGYSLWEGLMISSIKPKFEDRLLIDCLLLLEVEESSVCKKENEM